MILRALGVTPGMNLLAHTSMSSIGRIAGGAYAAVPALEAAVGDDGTLVMPSHSGDHSDHSDPCKSYMLML